MLNNHNDADAALIAAAPDLLATLAELIDAADGAFLQGAKTIYIDNDSSGWLSKARATVAKAKGDTAC